jgi:adenylate cyclase
MHDRVVTIRWRGIFPVPLDALWRLLSDTDRINRAVGLPPQTFQPSKMPGGQPVMEARGRYMGIPARWTELPFEWSFGRWFRSERVFTDTPFVRVIRTTNVFTARSANETEVEMVVDVVPRGLFSSVLLRLAVGKMLVPKVVRLYEQIVRNYSKAAEDPYPQLPHTRADQHQLERAAIKLRQAPVQPELIERLLALIVAADDREVVGARPFVLADRWNADRIEVLRLFLYATRAGLLDLSWEVLCPNCRVSKATFGTLASLRKEAHCETCNIEFDVNFDEYVEARFTVNPGIREAEVLTFCLAGPANTRHVVGQLRIPAGASDLLPMQLAPGNYRLRLRGETARAALRCVEREGPDTAEIRWNGQTLEPAEVVVYGGTCSLRLTNTADKETLLIVEHDAWGTQGASAALVTSLQEFRSLFSSEVLAPGMGVSVRNMTMLFSDLKGSTRMYSDIGDSIAYARVRDHFDVLVAIIQRHRGALVKTIGDAVMAVFLSAQDGFEAAVEMLDAMGELNERYASLPPLRIKLGIHRGPCLAINANDNLDYFGTTVNLAARLQGASQGDDIVMTQAMLDDPGVRQLLEDRGIVPEPFEALLAGYTEPFTLHRLDGRRDLGLSPALEAPVADQPPGV